jgi:hypothetical protein
MIEGNALPWTAFWIFLAVWIYCSHTQYMAGHETTFFHHKTPEEIRIREAVIKRLEQGLEQKP